MAAQLSADVAATYLEKVDPALPILFERDDDLLSLWEEDGQAQEVGFRTMRVPLHIRPGGKPGQYNLDQGDMGRGSGSKYVEENLTPVAFKYGVEISNKVWYGTNSRNKAVVDAVKREFTTSLKMFRTFLDQLIQTDGTARLGVVLTVTGANPYTLTLDTPEFASLLFFGENVEIVDTTRATSRGIFEITSYDVVNATVIANRTSGAGAPIVGDILQAEGVGVPSPSSLFGLKFHHSNASSGLYLNLDRATYPELRTYRVNAGTAAITPAHWRRALNLIRKQLGNTTLEDAKLIAYMNVDQEHALEAIGTNISQVQLTEVKNGMPDYLPGIKRLGGVPIKTSIHADATRIDFIAGSKLGRAVNKRIGIYKDYQGDTTFPLYAAGGGLLAGFIFYYDTVFQTWHYIPRLGAYIDNLTRPTGY